MTTNRFKLGGDCSMNMGPTHQTVTALQVTKDIPPCFGNGFRSITHMVRRFDTKIMNILVDLRPGKSIFMGGEDNTGGKELPGQWWCSCNKVILTNRNIPKKFMQRVFYLVPFVKRHINPNMMYVFIPRKIMRWLIHFVPIVKRNIKPEMILIFIPKEIMRGLIHIVLFGKKRHITPNMIFVCIPKRFMQWLVNIVPFVKRNFILNRIYVFIPIKVHYSILDNLWIQNVFPTRFRKPYEGGPFKDHIIL